VTVFEIVVSYPHADRERVVALRDALGVAVWVDDREIEMFASITRAIEPGLARSRVLLAFYSLAYPHLPGRQASADRFST
jgi:hypothetical protein